MLKTLIRFLFLLVLISCSEPKGATISSKADTTTAFSEPPEWSKHVVWYELAVDRFRNGDTLNDPTPKSIKGAYPGFVPKDWAITPWTQDWYEPDAYFSNFETQTDSLGHKISKFVDKLQSRRYGGDLQGVLDKIDYLDSLGITAIYFRPINDAPSLHKYDARNWRHVDINFGPNPELDKQVIASEIPDDPSTWKMTGADKLFLKVIDELHKRDIKLIIDYSWNHTGNMFWAWQDVLENQGASNYKDWYWIQAFDDPTTPDNEFKYHGWMGVPNLPELRETKKQDLSTKLNSFEGNIYSPTAKQHIFNVATRWLDPNGDGDTSDGVDGYRLDVAAELPLEFWKDFRKHVRQVNPDAYLMGEIWWEQWPDKLLDPAPFLEGDIFDGVMNYRWYKVVRQYFNESPNKITTSQFVDSLKYFRKGIKSTNEYALMSYSGGYDTPRIGTSLFNKNKYKYKTKLHEDANYKVHKPDAKTYQTLKLLLAQQFTFIGAPHIYAGDEMGMWGADDPSSRKPLIWPDYEFDLEKAHPLGNAKPINEVRFNEKLFSYYQLLAKIRKDYKVLNHGELSYEVIDDANDVLGYSRFNESSEVIALFNASDNTQAIQVPKKFAANYRSLLKVRKNLIQTKDSLIITLLPRSAAILGHQ